MTTAAIYARYSSTAQNDESIEQQVAECQAYAAQKGLAVVASFEDRAISGRSDNRPGFQRMLRAAERHEFQVLLAYKSNRISRNMKNALIYEDRLMQAGVRVVYCKEEFGDNATGRFMNRMMMNMNQFFSENMAEDIRRGMKDRASRACVNGVVPYGYRKGEDGRYEIDEATAPVVREIFQRFTAGESYAGIARALNAREIPTKQKKQWGKNSFHSILSNERYTGVYIYGDTRIEGGVPAIIDRGVYEMAKKQMRSLKEIRSRHRSDEDYLLTGKLYCGHCLGPMVGLSGKGHLGTDYFYYACQTRRKQKTCPKKHARKDYLEEEVARCVKECVLVDDVIEWIADTIVEMEKIQAAESKLAYYEQRLAETKKQIANIVRAVELGVIADEFKERMAELQESKKELTGLIATEKATTTHYDREDVIVFLEAFRDGDVRDKEFQRKVIRDFVRAIYLYDDHIKLVVDFTGEKKIYDYPIPIEGDADPVEDEVCIKSKVVYHYNLTQTPNPRNRIDVVDAGFVVTWYLDQ